MTTTSTSPPTLDRWSGYAVRFVDELKALVPMADGRAGDRAALARLRRSLTLPPGADPMAMPYVVRALPERASAATERAYYLAAGLFALHPLDWRPAEHSYRTNFGASFWRLRNQDAGPSIDRRFAALLDASNEALTVHLRHAVQLLRAHDPPIPVNWVQLVRDVSNWNSDDRRVQRAWASAYWRGGPPAEQAPDDTDNAAPHEEENA